MADDVPNYKGDAYWREPFTLEHFIYVLGVYEEIRRANQPRSDNTHVWLTARKHTPGLAIIFIG